MNTILNLSETKLNRQARLLLWFRENNVSFASLARRLNVTPASVGKWMRAEYIPCNRVERLKEAGIPEELLPQGMDVPCGPKPGWRELINV